MEPTQRIVRSTTALGAKGGSQHEAAKGNKRAGLALALVILTPTLATGSGAEMHKSHAEEEAPQTEQSWLIGHESKVRFDLARLDPEGLQGPSNGKRALHYEYCIPNRAAVVAEVAAIDPTLTIQRESPGRVGCDETELLCLGHTHQPGYRAVLEKLAKLAEIEKIQEAFFE